LQCFAVYAAASAMNVCCLPVGALERVASGGAVGPEPPRATGVGPEPPDCPFFSISREIGRLRRPI